MPQQAGQRVRQQELVEGTPQGEIEQALRNPATWKRGIRMPRTTWQRSTRCWSKKLPSARAWSASWRPPRPPGASQDEQQALRTDLLLRAQQGIKENGPESGGAYAAQCELAKLEREVACAQHQRDGRHQQVSVV